MVCVEPAGWFHPFWGARGGRIWVSGWLSQLLEHICPTVRGLLEKKIRRAVVAGVGVLWPERTVLPISRSTVAQHGGVPCEKG